MWYVQVSISINSACALISTFMPENGIPAREGTEHIGRHEPPSAYTSLVQDTLLMMSMVSLMATLHRHFTPSFLGADVQETSLGYREMKKKVTEDTFSFCPKYHIRYEQEQVFSNALNFAEMHIYSTNSHELMHQLPAE